MKRVDSAKIIFVRDMSDHDESFEEEYSSSDLTNSSDNNLIIVDNESTQDIENALKEMQDAQTQNKLDLSTNELISCLKRMLCNVNITTDYKDALTHYILSSFTYDSFRLASDYEIYDDICDLLFNKGQDIENYNAEYLIDLLVDILRDDQFFCRYANIFSQFILHIFLYNQIIEFDQLDKPANQSIYEKLSNFINNGENHSVAELEVIQTSSVTDSSC